MLEGGRGGGGGEDGVRGALGDGLGDFGEPEGLGALGEEDDDYAISGAVGGVDFECSDLQVFREGGRERDSSTYSETSTSCIVPGFLECVTSPE